MNLAAPFIQRPIATSLLAIGIAIAGATAFFFLPVASLPQIDFPTIAVSGSLPGASPEIMATSVATPLEREIGRIAGITQMTSSSSLGNTSVIVQFDLNRDINGAARDIQAAINAAQKNLPLDLPGNPTYRKVNPAEAPIMILTLTSNVYEVGDMYDYATTILQQRLSQVDGIGQVSVGGSSLPAVRINVNPNAVTNYGLSLAQIANVVANTNSNAPCGQLTIGDSLTNIVVDNEQLFSERDYKPLVVHYSNNSATKLSDVAEIEHSVENIQNAGMSNGKPAVVIILYKAPNANVIKTVDNVYKILPLLEASVPEQVEVSVILDRTVTIRASLREVEMTLLIAIFLVIAVVYIFLNSAAAALIPSVAVPLSLIGTFGVMYLLGFSLNNLSLIALTIVTGFVVDDAVVVLENASRHVEDGKSPFEAALLSAKEVGFTVVSMSTSLIAVFIPILLMGGIVGRLFREFAMTLSIAIMVSLLVSLTVTPTMCARILKKTDKNKEERAFLQRINVLYAKSLTYSLNHPRLMLTITILTVFLTIGLFIIVPKGFFPQQDTGRVIGSIQTQQNMSFKEIQNKLRQYMEISSKDEAVANAAGYVSTGASGGSGFVFLTLKNFEERSASADEVINRLREQFNVVKGASLILQSAQDIVIGGRMGAAQYQYTITANTLAELNDWAPKIMQELNKVPGVADLNSDQRDKGLEVFVDIDRDTAARLGVNVKDIDNALYTAFGQRQVATLYAQNNQYHIVMNVAEQFWQNPAMLESIYVPSKSGKQVPLAAIAHFATNNTLLAVNHQGQFPSATLSFNLTPGTSLGTVVTSIDEIMQKLTLPAGVYGTFQGNAQAFMQSLATEQYLVLGAIIVVYIVLGILYESLIHPITILSTIPSAGVGALLALLITGTDLTIIALIGIILLIGIVKKNAIMMIDFALQLERGQNMPSKQAIYEAAKLRFRPIMMTTCAALFGAIPLVVSQGIGSELRKPLGIAIIGGLIFSQMLTLYTTPVVYLAMNSLGNKCQKWFKPKIHAVSGGSHA